MNTDNLYTEKENFIVVLDSRNATEYRNSSKHSSVHFDLAEPIRMDKRAISMTCCVLHFQAPNSIYNINETNNLLYVTVFGLSGISYYIPNGNYNSTTLINYLSSRLPTGMTITIDTITNKFKITHTFDFTITGNIGPIMGFDTSASSSSNSLIMPYTCNFNGLQSFNIHFPSIVTKNIDSYNKSVSSIIQSIPIACGSNTISYIKNADFNFVINQEIIDDIQIDIKDDSSNYLNFNNCHWNLTLYFSIIKDVDRFKYANNFNSIINGYYN